MNRRDALKLLGGMGLMSVLPGAVLAAGERRYLSGYSLNGGRHFGSLATRGGERLQEWSLPGRAHGACVRPGNHELLLCARSPGTFVDVLDAAGRLKQRIEAPQGRHFMGHGAFRSDGRFFYTTENDYDGERGVIGVWDALAGYQRITEFDSGGIGPHEMLRMPGTDILVVANGGVLTHPETGSLKLNVYDMAPSLSFIDAADGRILANHRLADEWHQASIRHMDVNADGMVVAGLQYYGPRGDIVPLVTYSRAMQPLQITEIEHAYRPALSQYIGSVRFDATGRYLGTTSPRGGLAVFWDSQTMQPLADVRMTDVCGLAADGKPGGFLLTGGTGLVRHIRLQNGKLEELAALETPGIQWDNHMLSV